MPHLTLEYSSNLDNILDTVEVLTQVHMTMVETGEFLLTELKSRSIVYEDYLIGDGDESSAFVYLKISMISKRSDAIKKQVAKQALNILVDHLHDQEVSQCQVSVDLRDIDESSYFKAKL